MVRIVAGVAIALALPAAARAGAASDSGGPPASATALPGGVTWSSSGSGTGGSGGGFRVTPTRLVFEGRTRTAELTLVNTGAEPATFRVSLVRMRMSETGAVEEIADPRPGEAFADTLVRFSPRQVELEPGAAQTVRVQLRKPNGLAPGEYRSHLVFRALPPAGPEAESAAGRAARAVSIALRPVFGAAIPVIVRHGETRATVELGALELRPHAGPDGGPALALEMRRVGSQSVYGDLMVTCVPPGGRARAVGGMRGIAVYTPNALRRVLVPLRMEPGEPWTAGTLRVTYETAAGERDVLAEAEIAIR
jgi:P pilus assembly chaperone PapD